MLLLTFASVSGIKAEDQVTHVLVPLTAYGVTFYLDDKEGRSEFHKSLLTAVGTTYLLKAAVDKERPNHSNDDSFPSGHTAGAFMGAAFIHKRYGWKYAIPGYLAAAYVGHRRVEEDEHHTEDVIAGAAIGILSSFYFTTSYKGVEIQPYAEGNSYGVLFGTRW